MQYEECGHGPVHRRRSGLGGAISSGLATINFAGNALVTPFEGFPATVQTSFAESLFHFGSPDSVQRRPAEMVRL